MTRTKITISVDAAKLELVRGVTGGTSTSGVIDAALDIVLAARRNARDAAAYVAMPPTRGERALAASPQPFDGIEDDTDWAALYADVLGVDADPG